jgi:hypothetical protein
MPQRLPHGLRHERLRQGQAGVALTPLQEELLHMAVDHILVLGLLGEGAHEGGEQSLLARRAVLRRLDELLHQVEG